MKDLIKICQKTKNHFNDICKKNNTKTLLFSVKGGGCNGLKYSIVPLYDKMQKNDEIIKFEQFNIVICGKSLMYVLGTELKWKEDVIGSGIEFVNPNSTSNCGCGETFNVY